MLIIKTLTTEEIACYKCKSRRIGWSNDVETGEEDGIVLYLNSTLGSVCAKFQFQFYIFCISWVLKEIASFVLRKHLYFLAA